MRTQQNKHSQVSPRLWPRRSRSRSTHTLFLLLLSLVGCNDPFTCKGESVGPDPGSGHDAFAVAKIARWDGMQWHSLGKGVTSIADGVAAVHDIVIHEGYVYVAGIFDFAGEYEVNSVARWSGSNWQGFGNLVLPGVHSAFPTNKGSVYTLALIGDDAGSRMFVGGNFQTVYNDSLEGLNANNIARFDFSSGLWRTLGEGLNGEVNAIASKDATIYVAGAFQSANNLPNTNLIAQWQSSSGRWSEVGAGLYGYAVNTLLVNGNDLYVGGKFYLAGALSVNNVARWNGANWSTLGSGLNGEVYDLTFWGNELYAAGQFFTENYERFHSLARWRGGAWTLLGDQIAPGGGEDGYRIKGLTLEINGDNLYLGGRFDTMGEQPVNHVARWDKEGCFDLTGGTHEIGDAALSGVKALGILGDDIFAGGTFSSVGKQ